MDANNNTRLEMFSALTSLGCKLTSRRVDQVVDGQVVTTHDVDVMITAKGATVVRTVRDGEAISPAALVKEMRAELAARNKRTSASIRAERSVNRS